MSHQLTRSWCSVFFHYVVLCVMVLFAPDPAGGISWPTVPDQHTYVEQGSPLILHWHYRMNDNETFLSSEIEKKVKQIKISTLASSHNRENTYYKYKKEDNSFSVFGKTNVTFTVHRAEAGQNITYCCEVVWKSVVGKRKETRCSKVFVYDMPRITYHILQLSCKQGDLIRLQCNATGIPKPRVGWKHDDTQELIDSSADIVLNITGKRSEGRYCCDAKNGFGRKTACTTVNVTEYKPENTTLLVKQTNRDDVNLIHIECKADASPPSNRFIITFNKTRYNSSDGLQTIEVRAPRKDKRYEIAIICIPCNKYGQGPPKTKVLALHVPPRFIAPIRTQYNMTVSSITVKCYARGIPSPNITWIDADTGDIVGTGKDYQFPYVKCATKTLRFYCHARNVMGNISSPEIHVEVHSVTAARNCSTADKGFDQKTSIIIGGVVVFVIVVGSVPITFWWKRKIEARKDAETSIHINEDPYHDPIDAVVPEREGSQSLIARKNTTSSDEGYATVAECGIGPKREVRIPMITVKTNPHPGEEE